MKPIMISLKQIKAHRPCASGWRKLLAAKGKTEADDELFPLSDAIGSNGAADTIWAFRCLPEYNALWRKFACWCALQHIEKAKRFFKTEAGYNLVVTYLETGDENLRQQARKDAAYAAAAADAADAAYAAAAYAYAAAAASADAADAAYAAAAASASAYVEKEKQAAKLKQILDTGDWVEK